MLSCDVWTPPVEGALSYTEAPSTTHRCRLQHLLPTCAEKSSTFQLCSVFFFFFRAPCALTPRWSGCLHRSYAQAVGREGEVREHHLVSECKRNKVPLHILPSICLLHAQYSPSNWRWWVICFQCPFLFTSAPNALLDWRNYCIFLQGWKERGGCHTEMISES